MYLIGIDVGVHTGLAVWDCYNLEFMSINTAPIHTALAVVQEWAECHDIKVIFEDARKRKWIPLERDFSQVKGRAMGAGSVRRDSQIWEDFLRDKKIPFEAVPPQKGATKMSAEAFERLTGWKKRTSNHGRDAALLVFEKCPF